MKRAILILVGGLMLAADLVSQPANLLDDISQSVRVTVVVRKKARLELMRTWETINVRQEDLARGYVLIPGAFDIRLWCNSPEGSRIYAELDHGLLSPQGGMIGRQNLEIRLSGTSAFTGFDQGLLTIYESDRKETGTAVSCDLKLKLPPNTIAGPYRLNITFRAEPK